MAVLPLPIKRARNNWERLELLMEPPTERGTPGSPSAVRWVTRGNVGAMPASEFPAPSRASDLPAKRRLLAATRGALVCRPRPDRPELQLVHAWLDNWRGVGLIAAGMRRQGYDLIGGRGPRCTT